MGWEQRMPEIKWEWRVGPQTLLSLAQLVAIIVAIIGGFLKMQTDINAQQQTVTKLESLVSSIRDAQSSQSERVTRVETKVDLIFPTLQRIEARQIREPTSQGR